MPYFQVDNENCQIGYGVRSVVVNNCELQSKMKASEILKQVSEGRVGNIPIFAVTGSNGKTTTARLIYHILKGLGFTVGLAYTGGILIGEERVREGDTTGFYSARDVLSDKRVEAAVLETARGGILSNGLGYKNALVGVITTISEDHLGLEGISTLEDLAKVKAAVINEVSREGKVVIKSQKELIEIAKDIPVAKVCLFSLQKNKYICEHIRKGGEAFYLEDNYIIHNVNNEEAKLLNINQLDFTYRGASRSNILNIMAAIGAVAALYKDYEGIIDIIKNVKCDVERNKGRQNLIDLGKVKLLLDYGHNPEAYEEVFSLVKKLKPKKITASIICPGDRTDDHIKKLGYIAGCNSDFLILREPDRPRGRDKEEILKLFWLGTKDSGLGVTNICEASDELEAVKLALDKAVEGEVIVIFVEDVDRILDAVENYKKNLT